MVVERAMLLWVGCRDWQSPKAILASTDGDYGRKLDEIAQDAFAKYAAQQNENIYLVSYSYQGDVEIFGNVTE